MLKAGANSGLTIPFYRLEHGLGASRAEKACWANGRQKGAPGLRIAGMVEKTPGEQAEAIAMARSLGITILAEQPIAKAKLEPDLATLEAALERSWSAKTSYYSDWTPQNPAYGQCAVTALIVQDYFGGELVFQATTPGEAHFWNQLKDGTKVDLTERQFVLAPVIRDPQTSNPVRQRVLSVPATQARYALLKAEVEKNLLLLAPPEVSRELLAS